MKTIKWLPMITNDKGNALLVSLIILVVLLLIGVAALKISNTETLAAGNEVTVKQAFQAAEGASDFEAAQLKNYLAASLVWSPPISTINSSIPPPSIPGYTLQETSPIAQVAGSQVTKNATGLFNGLTAWCQSYTVTTTARENNGRGKATLVRLMEDQLIPLFQFGVFYQNLLEIFPGANMTFTGRIHSNSDIKLGTHATLTVQQDMTAGGTITTYQPGNYHGENFAGPVTLDGQIPGIPQLSLPIPEGHDPIDLIQRGTESYRLESKSGLKIIDGTAYNKNNQVVNLSSCSGNNPVSTDTFYDRREAKNVSATQISLTKLQNCPAAYNALNDPPAGGDPGILYVSKTPGTDLSAVRVIDGADLYTSGKLPHGLMVATDNPLYIQGNFNTTLVSGKPVPVALASDALTILSSSWTTSGTNNTDDNSKNHHDDLGYRVASDTTVNAAIMTGNVETVDPTTGAQYSGGLENFPRFLENWTGKTFTYGGSLACLWQSQRATGRWFYGSPVYTAPNRSWSYNMNPNNMPPGTPRVRNLQRIQWYQVRN